jgi:hypothetical protein
LLFDTIVKPLKASSRIFFGINEISMINTIRKKKGKKGGHVTYITLVFFVISRDFCA